MLKKVLVGGTSLALILSSTVFANSDLGEPKYDDEGNLILDTEQERFKDLSSQQSAVEEPKQNLPALPALSGDKLPTDTEKIEGTQDDTLKVRSAPTNKVLSDSGLTIGPDGKLIFKTGWEHMYNPPVDLEYNPYKLHNNPTRPVILDNGTALGCYNPEFPKPTFSTTPDDPTDPEAIWYSIPECPQEMLTVDAREARMIPAGVSVYKDKPLGDNLKSNSNVAIVSVESIGYKELPSNAYSISADKMSLIFNAGVMNSLDPSDYSIRVTHEGKAISEMIIKVTPKRDLFPYWEQSINEFSKLKEHRNHQDLIIYTTITSADLDKLTYDDVLIPPQEYRVEGNNIIISKNYLSQRPVTDYESGSVHGLIHVFLKDGKDYPFFITISDKPDETTNKTLENIDC